MTAEQARVLEHAREVLAEEAKVDAAFGPDAEWQRMLRLALKDIVKAFDEGEGKSRPVTRTLEGEGQMASYVMATPDGPLLVEAAVTMREIGADDPRRPGDVLIHGDQRSLVTLLHTAAEAVEGAG
jgi:hypothetical protein